MRLNSSWATGGKWCAGLSRRETLTSARAGNRWRRDQCVSLLLLLLLLLLFLLSFVFIRCVYVDNGYPPVGHRWKRWRRGFAGGERGS